MHIYVKVSKLVKGNQKALFSLATTPRCWGKHYFFPWVAPIYP